MWPFESVFVWMKNWRPSPLRIFHSLPATTPSTCAFWSVTPLKFSSVSSCPLFSFSWSGPVPSVVPSAFRSVPGCANRVVHELDRRPG